MKEDQQKNFVLNLLAYAVQKDISPEQLCTLSGIDLVALKKRAAVIITHKQLDDLWHNASYLANDAVLGLHFGESLRLAALGIVGEIIQNSRTIGEALTHAAGFIHLITDLFTMEVNRSGKTFTVRFVPYKDRGKEYPFAFRHMMDLSMVFVLYELDGLILEKIKPKSVKFPYTSLHDPQEYERVLRCKPVKQTDDYFMEFDSRYWDEPILTANYELQSLLLKKASAMNTGASDRQLLKDKISGFLLANAYLGIPSLEELAANFNASPRSLQRKLQEEGVTYQQLADAIRKTLALHYLESGNYQIKEISYILGYNELSAFTRAFKRWTGTTPIHFQKR